MAKIINTAVDDLTKLNKDETHWVYNGLDCCVTEEVWRNLRAEVDTVALSTYEFSKALQAPVLEMNLRGILVNQRERHRIIAEFENTKSILEEQYNTIINEVFEGAVSWSSPHQVKKLLYDVMGLPVQRKRNAKGSYSPTVEREALESLSAIYYIAEPIINHILALRDLQKSIGFLRTGIDPDGRMRTDLRIAGTNTGRWSSSETDYGTGTNLQNVTKKLRRVFVADPGYKLANLDLEQGDSRNVGALCWNIFSSHPDWTERSAGAYLDACESGDLHTTVAKMTLNNLPWGTAPDREIAETVFYRGLDYRDMCKRLGHGSNYLGKPPQMARATKFPVNVVEDFQEKYFGAFPVIPAFQKWVADEIDSYASLTSPFGRRRYFFGRATNMDIVREAVAYMPQSMTADEINTGILNIWRANKVQLLMQVHDSVLFQYPEEQEDEILPWAIEALQTHLTLAKDRDFVVPTDAAVGWNWGYEKEDNPDGLVNWKGGDSRKRQTTDFRLSILGV